MSFYEAGKGIKLKTARRREAKENYYDYKEYLVEFTGKRCS
jgi:hypothetical protein